MKTFNAMTPIQIASTVIEKLQEQNRISMEALQKTQSDMRRLEKELTEKEQLLKIMEGKVRQGSKTYLEMNNRQKEITIKHLELQIQKLLKGNEDLERQVSLAKSDICEKCETKYFMGASVDNKPTSKSSVRKFSGKKASTKQVSETESQKREKMLERIIEHKDKRIFSLTKEIQRLSQVEKELSNKIFRLTKLLPMSHMSTEVLTECLLKEIQSLELQIQHYQEKYDKFTDFGQNKSSKSNSNLFDSKSRTSLEKMDANVKNYGSSSRNVNQKFNGSSSQKNVGISLKNVQEDNGSMVSKLHLLYNDVVELKQFFASENEKLYLNLSKESLRNDMLKTQWEEVLGRLSEIAEGIQSILQVNSQFVDNKSADSNDKENIILRLQDRLKEALELTTQYENENSELKCTVEKLKNQMQEDRISNQYSQTDVRQSPNRNSPQKNVSCHSVDTQHLKELLNEKQKQLDSVESHLRTYQNFVEQLQGVSKESLQASLQESLNTGNENTTNQAMNFQRNNDVRSSTNQKLSNRNVKEVSMETKLEVAERNIKTLEDVMEDLQRVIKSLVDENDILKSEINLSKRESVLSKANIDPNASLEAKLKDSEEELVKVQSSNKDLESNVHSLEEVNLSLKESLQEVSSKLEQQQLEADEQRTVLQSKLDMAEKSNSTLETNVVCAQNAIEELKEENASLKSTLQTSESRKSLEDRAQNDNIMELKNQLILKDDKIQSLKKSLYAIEGKAAEMSFHRRVLRQEIEKLCDVLLEKSDPNNSTESRNAIYKIAVLMSAKALLEIDEDYNVQSKTNNNGRAFEEMSQQVSVYLTEVARIQELLTIKNKQREDLLKEYLDGFMELSHLPGLSHSNPSGVTLLPASSAESASESSSESGVHTSRKSKQTAAKNAGPRTGVGPQSRQDEQDDKSITEYLQSRCLQLENLLEKEQQDNLLRRKEIETLKESNAILQGQFNSKSKIFKLLSTLIELLRSKGCSNEIAVELLRSDMKFLMAENQKMFEKSALTQNELCKHKEENVRMQKDLDDLRRERVSEKYDFAKANIELKHLHEQILNEAASMLNNGDIST